MAWFYSQPRSIDSLIPLILPFQSMANKQSSEFSLRFILKKIVFSTDQRNTSFYECLGYSWSSVLDPGSGYRSIFGLTPTKRVIFIGADLNHVLPSLLTHKHIAGFLSISSVFNRFEYRFRPYLACQFRWCYRNWPTNVRWYPLMKNFVRDGNCTCWRG